MREQKPKSTKAPNTSRQRKTTLKWGRDGELSALDMARILEKLESSELTECDLACTIKNVESQ